MSSIGGVPGTLSCSKCGKLFTSKNSLNWHMKSHIPEAALPCQYCDKSFYSTTTLKNHTLLHRKEKPHKCTECQASFAQKVSLNYHMRKHTEVLPFPCDYCKCPGFSYKRALRKHWVTEHADIFLATRKFLCGLCWEPFYSEDELSVHRTTHHFKHKCQVCGYQFTMRAHLTEHLLRHSRVKPFGCKLCPDMKFLRRAELRRHVCQKHPGDSPIICETEILVDLASSSPTPLGKTRMKHFC